MSVALNYVLEDELNKILKEKVSKLICEDDADSYNIMCDQLKGENKLPDSIINISEEIELTSMKNEEIFYEISNLIIQHNAGPDFVYCSYCGNGGSYDENAPRPHCMQCENRYDCIDELSFERFCEELPECLSDRISSLFGEIFKDNTEIYGEVDYSLYDYETDIFVDSFGYNNSCLIYDFFHNHENNSNLKIMVNHAQQLMFSELMIDDFTSGIDTTVVKGGGNLILFNCSDIENEIDKKCYLTGGNKNE